MDLYIPKISISGGYDLGGIMGDMGIADLLNNRTHFSGITQEALPKVSKVGVSRARPSFPPKFTIQIIISNMEPIYE